METKEASGSKILLHWGTHNSKHLKRPVLAIREIVGNAGLTLLSVKLQGKIERLKPCRSTALNSYILSEGIAVSDLAHACFRNNKLMFTAKEGEKAKKSLYRKSKTPKRPVKYSNQATVCVSLSVYRKVLSSVRWSRKASSIIIQNGKRNWFLSGDEPIFNAEPAIYQVFQRILGSLTVTLTVSLSRAVQPASRSVSKSPC